MCGIAGFLSNKTETFDNWESIVTSMARKITSRGPDDEGIWGQVNEELLNDSTNFNNQKLIDRRNSNNKFCLALGFRRLSILDLSEAGHQPMTSNNNRYVLSFNGEIYNHLELRSLFTGVSIWKGHSDTETLLACIERFGIKNTLLKTVGMFAIALWDKELQILHLIRDRFGEKPLYYGWVPSVNYGSYSFVFGSELKALRAYPNFSNEVSLDALKLYMGFNYVPAPHSIYEGIFKLEPGCSLSINANKLINTQPFSSPPRPGSLKDGVSMQRWWSLADVVQNAKENQFTSESEAVQKLEEQLFESVQLQSKADVPIGAFLSGGVDSSTIVALMKIQGNNSVKTFTIGFEEKGFDESPHAKAVAKHLKTEHTEMFVSSKESQSIIQELPIIYDEPFADSSQIPTYLVSKLAKQKVTVALSGDAGDELFGGYSRYIWSNRIWKRLNWMPYTVRLALGSAIKKVPYATWDFFGQPIAATLDNSKGIVRFGEKIHKLANRLEGVRNLNDLYISLVTEWQDPSLVVKEKKGLIKILNTSGKSNSPLEEHLIGVALPETGIEAHQLRMMFLDSMTYLPDDILCKVDRASMATSLETRVPFLDHRLAEIAWRLPIEMKIRNGQGKWALRQVLYKYVPKELIDRPKAGFGIPVGLWLRGPLRQWAEDLLKSERLESDGYFYSEPIRLKWREHLSGKFDHTASIWAVLMFQSWLDVYRPTRS